MSPSLLLIWNFTRHPLYKPASFSPHFSSLTLDLIFSLSLTLILTLHCCSFSLLLCILFQWAGQVCLWTNFKIFRVELQLCSLSLLFPATVSVSLALSFHMSTWSLLFSGSPACFAPHFPRLSFNFYFHHCCISVTVSSRLVTLPPINSRNVKWVSNPVFII